MSVLARPRSTTAAPWETAPSANAATSDSPVRRMSRATTTDGAPVNRAKATPSARATSSFIWSGVVPLTS